MIKSTISITHRLPRGGCGYQATGTDGGRTHNFLRAKQVLSQLNYSPIYKAVIILPLWSPFQ